MRNIKQEPVVSDDCGYWAHPNLPLWDEGTTIEQVNDWAKENNGTIVMFFVPTPSQAEMDSKFNELAKAASDLVVASSKLSNASNAEEAEAATEAIAELQARVDAIVKAKGEV